MNNEQMLLLGKHCELSPVRRYHFKPLLSTRRNLVQTT